MYTESCSGASRSSHQTVPSPDPTQTSFNVTVSGGPTPPPTGSSDLSKPFPLTDGGTTGNLVVGPGAYSAVETVPANWQLTGATCVQQVPGGPPIPVNATFNPATATLSGIAVGANETVVCTL